MKNLKNLLNIGLVSGALLTGTALDSCASLSQMVQRDTVKHSFEPSVMKVVPFQEYYPGSNSKKIELKDKMLETYVSQAYSIDELSLSILNSHAVDNIEEDHVKTVNISNYDKFKSEIILAAEELGYLEEDLTKLSVHDAVMLSGKLVANRLDYYSDMIDEETEKLLPEDPEELFYTLLLMSFSDIDTRNKEAKRIDETPDDKIFYEGNGICRNYAGVNSAVFQVLKDMNPDLKNTYVRWYTPQDLGHSLAFQHAWNQVSTIKKTDKGLEILVTYVDPTWLDTRNKTAKNIGERLEEIDDEEIYNALDVAHFGSDTLLANVYIADLYEVLGTDSRPRGIDRFRTSASATDYYTKKAFEQRMKICGEILNITEENLEDFENVDFYFGESFQKGIENMVNCPTSIFLEYGYSSIYPKNIKQFERLKSVYERTLKIVPKYVEGNNLSYPKIESYIEDGKEYLRSVQNELSMKDLLTKVESEYSKP